MKKIIKETIIETVQKIFYGFGFGLGMNTAFNVSKEKNDTYKKN